MAYRSGRTTKDRVRPSSTFASGEPPVQGELQPGEIAVNIADATLYIADASGTPVPVSGGGSSYDQSLNTTDDVTFNSITLPNYTQVVVGSFDNTTGGANGLSLICAVGYELNWQGGRLKNVYNNLTQTIHVDSPIQFHAGVLPKIVALTYAATVTTDASAGEIFDLTLTGNVTLANPTNPVDGKTIRWRIRQDATGSRTVTLGNKFVIPSSATSPLPFSTAANKMDILAATYDAARDKWDIIAFVMGY
jgi:hypothetical protein